MQAAPRTLYPSFWTTKPRAEASSDEVSCGIVQPLSRTERRMIGRLRDMGSSGASAPRSASSVRSGLFGRAFEDVDERGAVPFAEDDLQHRQPHRLFEIAMEQILGGGAERAEAVVLDEEPDHDACAPAAAPRIS